MNEGLHKLQSVQLIVTISVMHLEVVKLKLLLCHLGCVNMLNMLLHVLSLLGNPLFVLNDSPLLWLTLWLALLWLPLNLLLGLPLKLLLLWLTLQLWLALLRLPLELLLRLTLELLLRLPLKLLLLGWGRASLELLWRRLTLELLLRLPLKLLLLGWG